jgi:hypothetical protein
MGGISAGAAKTQAGGSEEAAPVQSGDLRDTHPDGNLSDAYSSERHPAGRTGGVRWVQIDAVELPLDSPGLDSDLGFALDYWRRKRGRRIAPARGDIDPVEIARVLPRVMLVDVSADPVDFRFRLAGTGLFKIHGGELTSKRALDLEPPAYGALIHGHYCDALARCAPVAHRVRIECETRRSAYMRIILPLSEDGQSINRLMTVESYADAAQDLRDCFEEARATAGCSSP